jgi:D-alanyl-D-alanine endopeptidase (penicillin-binding protein 7)
MDRRQALLMVASAFCGSSLADAASSRPPRKANEPDVRSNAALVIDCSNHSAIFARGADAGRPIASITKLMTAMVVLDAQLPLDETLEITKADGAVGKGTYSRLAYGTRLSRADLMCLALMSSENRAAHTLGRNYPGGKPAFVRAMNEKAESLGMTKSRFVDASGLSSLNVASAKDLARLVTAAAKSRTIGEYSTRRSHIVTVGRQKLEFRNTNSLVNDHAWDISIQKTGYISEAGQCLVMQATVEKRPVIFVLLDSFGKYTRVADARRIRQWMAIRSARAALSAPKA